MRIRSALELNKRSPTAMGDKKLLRASCGYLSKDGVPTKLDDARSNPFLPG